MTDKPDHKDTGLVPTTDKTLTTRSSALIRRGLNAVESLDGFDPGLEGDHNPGMASQSEAKTQSTGERLDAYLEEKGAVRKVGPDYYADFENLNDEQMRTLIALVIAASEKELNRMLLDEEKRYTDPDLLKHIENKLWAISRGWLSLGEDDGKLYIHKPAGPEPTPEMKQLLDDRIARAVPQIGPTLIELVRKSVTNST